jgi:hypothetical protein
MADAAADQSEIEGVLQLYIDGTRDGDVTKLREAFHDDARMFGSLGGQRADVPIAELFKMSDGHPADVDGSYEARILAIEQVGDAAVATLEEDGFWGSLSFTDFFSLVRTGDSWKIANKTFAHTGGEPPPM